MAAHSESGRFRRYARPRNVASCRRTSWAPWRIDVANKFGLAFIEHFVTEAEREHLIELIDDRAEYLPTPTDLVWPNPPRRCDLSRLGDQTIFEIECRMARALGVPRQFGEGLQGQLYSRDEEYATHFDAFHMGTPSYDREMPRGGQRPFSALIYLEAPRGGGSTYFPNLGVSIEPRPGLAVFWSNLDANHLPHRMSMHGATPVLAG